MTTPTAQPASQLIADTLLELNVIRLGQTPSADQQALMIRKLNEMMAQWEGEGRHLGYIPVGTVTNTLTVPDAAIAGIRASLAIFAASSFSATVSPELIASAEMGMATIHKLCAKEIQSVTDLQPSVDTGGRYNIETGA